MGQVSMRLPDGCDKEAGEKDALNEEQRGMALHFVTG